MNKNKVSLDVVRKANQRMIDKNIVDDHYKTVHENKQQLEQFLIKEHLKLRISYNPNDTISNMERFTPLSNGEMLEDLDGEYVLFSSVLNIFAPKPKTFKELFKNTNIKPTTDEDGNISYSFKADKNK